MRCPNAPMDAPVPRRHVRGRPSRTRLASKAGRPQPQRNTREDDMADLDWPSVAADLEQLLKLR
ncbi:hypothetical protein, partial [Phenylobacterium sp.]|uniref:hypothetical protein n=1 Tax=Phenylobacterium sp. TaxID=1871053 RepID=UPI0025FE77B7